MPVLLPRLVWLLFAPAVNGEIHGGHEKHGDDHGEREAADDGAGQRRVLLAAGFQAERHGNHAQQRGQRGHQDRTQTDFAGLHRGLQQRQSLFVEHVGELDDQNGVRHHDAGHHDDAHQRHDVQRAAGEDEEEDDADQARRNGHEDDERIDERSELRHEDQVDEQDGDDESEAKVLKRLVHADHRAAHVDDRVLVVLRMREQVVDLPADALQRFALRRDVDVDHAADLVVVDLGGRVDLVDVRDRAERDDAAGVAAAFKRGGNHAGLARVLHGAVAGRTLGVQGNVLEILHGHVIDPVIGVLHGDEVVVAAVRIDPVAGRHHAAGSERSDHVVDHVFGAEADESWRARDRC